MDTYLRVRRLNQLRMPQQLGDTFNEQLKLITTKIYIMRNIIEILTDVTQSSHA